MVNQVPPPVESRGQRETRIFEEREVEVNAESQKPTTTAEVEPSAATGPAEAPTRQPQWPRVSRRTPEQLFFVRRLRRLIALNRYCTSELPTDDPEMRLLRHAIYSTYRDCVDQGLADEAQEILAELRNSAPARTEAARS